MSAFVGVSGRSAPSRTDRDSLDAVVWGFWRSAQIVAGEGSLFRSDGRVVIASPREALAAAQRWSRLVGQGLATTSCRVPQRGQQASKGWGAGDVGVLQVLLFWFQLLVPVPVCNGSVVV